MLDKSVSTHTEFAQFNGLDSKRMAERGGQPGNNNASKNKPWHYAIQRALRKRSRSDQLEALDELAEAFLDAVKSGDIQAFRELGDRLDGKATQQIDATVDGSLTVQIVRMSDDNANPPTS